MYVRALGNDNRIAGVLLHFMLWDEIQRIL